MDKLQKQEARTGDRGRDVVAAAEAAEAAEAAAETGRNDHDDFVPGQEGVDILEGGALPAYGSGLTCRDDSAPEGGLFCRMDDLGRDDPLAVAWFQTCP